MEQDYCVHPGQIMSAILLSINKSPRWLANKTNTEYATIKNILEGKISVTPSIATAFEKATKFPAHSLLYQQEKFELFRSGVKKMMTNET